MIKPNIKLLNMIILIILIAATSIATVCAEKIIASKNIIYNNQNSWINSSNVHNAVDKLYENCIINTFVRYLQSLPTGTTILSDDGTADHNMRYIGLSPNNYVTFEGEEWRIIGAFNNIDNGTGKKETRVKIIKSSSIGTKAWDSNKTNIWKNASLNIELQKLYTSSTLIENAVWNLGDNGENLSYTKISYEIERGTAVASGNDVTWTGRVGIMYPSDYGFASSACKDGSKTLREYNDSSCTTTNWLYLNANEWLLSPMNSGTKAVRAINNTGYANTKDTSTDLRAVRPTVYLKSNVMCENCKESTAGTKSNPFRIK